jgi:hypothetical protein
MCGSAVYSIERWLLSQGEVRAETLTLVNEAHIVREILN